jgi:Skp family chaperone for outer membrane proteins
MRNRLLRVSALLCLLVSPALAHSQDQPLAASSKIGLINIQEAIASTTEGKKALSDIQKKYEPHRNDLERQQQEINALQDELQKRPTALSDEEQVRLNRELEEKQRLFKRAQEDAQVDYQNDNQADLRRIGQKMVRVINDYAQQNGFALVLDPHAVQMPVYYAAKGLDITDAIVKRYHAANPGVTRGASSSSASTVKTATTSKPADNPDSLQKQGIQRVDKYIEYLRRTGDRVSLIPELHKAQDELTASSSEFVARQDFVGAALSFIKLGDIERLQDHWDSALTLYTRARELAKQANHSGYQARALTLLTKTEVLRSGNLGVAATYIGEAIRLATEAGNKDYLFEALDQAGVLEVERGNLNAAADCLDRALAMKDELQDKPLLMYGYMHRARLYDRRGEKCDCESSFDICDQTYQLAHTDYEQALRIAQAFGFQFNADSFQAQLRNTDARRRICRGLLENKPRRSD